MIFNFSNFTALYVRNRLGRKLPTLNAPDAARYWANSKRSTAQHAETVWQCILSLSEAANTDGVIICYFVTASEEFSAELHKLADAHGAATICVFDETEAAKSIKYRTEHRQEVTI